ncbi:MAG TPA: tRNA (adenosine(37)-N6)-threonylcarbamoyltransferase complex dimerization subunit type 1 TsaB [Spongiibacteraceae bacterium]|nr:tRNA (adenosine(37)-N6)-threonylcarbamoyltransferase complex dimerization subunit type 1 TsaB [Spongiibacteraceae bacterium]
MPRLLAIDTSTEACSVALYDGVNVRELCVDAPREHVQRILPMIDTVLADYAWTLRDLDAIAFARGPGSFTGLRICLGIVQGLAYGANLPVLPVSTLAALAQTAVIKQAAIGSYVCSAIDARMDEIYCGWFRVGDDGLVVAANEECVCKPEALPLVALPATSACYGVGTGWRYGGRLPQFACESVDADLLPRASAVARLALVEWHRGVRLAAHEAQPVYLRNEVAWAKDPVWGKPSH